LLIYYELEEPGIFISFLTLQIDDFEICLISSRFP